MRPALVSLCSPSGTVFFEARKKSDRGKGEERRARGKREQGKGEGRTEKREQKREEVRGTREERKEKREKRREKREERKEKREKRREKREEGRGNREERRDKAEHFTQSTVGCTQKSGQSRAIHTVHIWMYTKEWTKQSNSHKPRLDVHIQLLVASCVSPVHLRRH